MGRRKEVYLEDVMAKSLGLLDRTLTKLEDWEKASRSDDPGDFDLKQLSALDRTTRALAQLVKELRAMSKDNQQRASKMGPSEMRHLILEWFQKLPKEHQKTVLWEFQGLHRQQYGEQLDA